MLKMRRSIAAILCGVMLLSAFTACGKKDDKKYVSPNLNNPTTDNTATGSDARSNYSVPGDYSIYSPASPLDATKDDKKSQSITGYYTDSAYYNEFAGFALQVDNNTWRFYDAATVASLTDATEDEINNYWYGVSSPYATKLTYCAVAYSKETGSNIIISYVNPKAYYMSDLTPVEYLNMTASKYTGLTVSEGPYLGKTYAMLDIPADQSSIGERAQFVTEVEGLLVVITYTVQEGDSLKGLSNHIVQLNTKK